MEPDLPLGNPKYLLRQNGHDTYKVSGIALYENRKQLSSTHYVLINTFKPRSSIILLFPFSR